MPLPHNKHASFLQTSPDPFRDIRTHYTGLPYFKVGVTKFKGQERTITPANVPYRKTNQRLKYFLN